MDRAWQPCEKASLLFWRPATRDNGDVRFPPLHLPPRRPMTPRVAFAWTVLLLCNLSIGPLAAQDTSAAQPTAAKPDQATPSENSPADKSTDAGPIAAGPLPGHSYHGEVFNEGPRQKAYLMTGMPKIHFPVTTKSTEAQSFIEQG